MTDKELWLQYCKENDVDDENYEAWAFGVEADLLAELVVKGDKTTTASAYPMYEVENEPLPKIGGYNIILDSKEQAVCITKTTKVYIKPFNEVSAEHAYKEGEGDRSLAFWRECHSEVFAMELSEAGLTFDESMPVVCEEFKVVYRG